MGIPYYQVDAFSTAVFTGNPAGVCLLDAWPEDSLLQNIAQENSVPETAFLVGSGTHYQLRWFTPQLEMDLCGHATLASGFVLKTFYQPDAAGFTMETRSGTLQVACSQDLYTLDFPARPGRTVPTPLDLTIGLGGPRPEETLLARDHLAVFASEEQVRALKPDFSVLLQLSSFGVIATAPGNECDYVTRFFAPRTGTNEDPATGSTHCTLVPYWSARLAVHRHEPTLRRPSDPTSRQLLETYLAGRGVDAATIASLRTCP